MLLFDTQIPNTHTYTHTHAARDPGNEKEHRTEFQNDKQRKPELAAALQAREQPVLKRGGQRVPGMKELTDCLMYLGKYKTVFIALHWSICKK